MAIGGCEVSYCFFKIFIRPIQVGLFVMKEKEKTEYENPKPDLTDASEARKAFIASEIFRRKYN